MLKCLSGLICDFLDEYSLRYWKNFGRPDTFGGVAVTEVLWCIRKPFFTWKGSTLVISRFRVGCKHATKPYCY